MRRMAAFTLDEKVVIRAAPASATVGVDGATGRVLGMAQSETGEWSYAVSLDGDERCWSILEEELESLDAFEAPGAPGPFDDA